MERQVCACNVLQNGLLRVEEGKKRREGCGERKGRRFWVRPLFSACGLVLSRESCSNLAGSSTVCVVLCAESATLKFSLWLFKRRQKVVFAFSRPPSFSHARVSHDVEQKLPKCDLLHPVADVRLLPLNLFLFFSSFSRHSA